MPDILGHNIPQRVLVHGKHLQKRDPEPCVDQNAEKRRLKQFFQNLLLKGFPPQHRSRHKQSRHRHLTGQNMGLQDSADPRDQRKFGPEIAGLPAVSHVDLTESAENQG